MQPIVLGDERRIVDVQELREAARQASIADPVTSPRSRGALRVIFKQRHEADKEIVDGSKCPFQNFLSLLNHLDSRKVV